MVRRKQNTDTKELSSDRFILDWDIGWRSDILFAAYVVWLYERVNIFHILTPNHKQNVKNILIIVKFDVKWER